MLAADGGSPCPPPAGDPGMVVAVKALSSGLNSQIPNFRNDTPIASHRQMIHFGAKGLCSQTVWLSIHMRNVALESSRRTCSSISTEAGFLSPDLPEVSASSSSFEDVTVTANANENGEIKLTIDVSGSKTQGIFDNVFSKLVAAAQPIPGFRRVKGGKTPDIPKDVQLQILGPSKVNKQTINKIINNTVAEYVEKEGLKVAKDLKVDQSFEALEAIFEPGKEFSFNANIQLLEER